LVPPEQLLLMYSEPSGRPQNRGTQMEKDEFPRPDAPRPPQTHVSFRTVPAYSAHVNIKGRYSPLLSRIIKPFGRILIAWLAWRQRRGGTR
jgi:hypothetical protein